MNMKTLKRVGMVCGVAALAGGAILGFVRPSGANVGNWKADMEVESIDRIGLGNSPRTYQAKIVNHGDDSTAQAIASIMLPNPKTTYAFSGTPTVKVDSTAGSASAGTCTTYSTSAANYAICDIDDSALGNPNTDVYLNFSVTTSSNTEVAVSAYSSSPESSVGDTSLMADNFLQVLK
jgi:hypothetical protein